MTTFPNNEDSDQISFVKHSEVGQQVRRGAVWSALQIILRNVLSVGSTAILARLLRPEDYGLVGMIATLTALLQVFSNMGLSWATVQRKGLTRAQVSGLFWFNCTAGVVLWVTMAIAAPFLATFYNEPALTMLAIVSSATFFLSGVAVQPLAMLTRAMAFDKIAMIEVLALALGACAGVTLAVADAGYWALVGQATMQATVRAAMSLYWSKIEITAPRWTPGLGSMVRFGGVLVVNGFLIYLARNLDSVLVGKVWGPNELGVYNRAYFLMLLPSTITSGVLSGLMVSSLAALQDDRDRFGEAYRRALCLVAFVGTPLSLGLALTAAPAVELVYGSGWEGVVSLLVWLSLAGITQPIYNTVGWLFTASGRVRIYLFLTLGSSVILSGVFLLTIHHGVEALAKGYGIAMGLVIPIPALWLAHRAAKIPLLASLRTLAPVAVLNGIMGLAVWAIWIGANVVGLPHATVFPVQVAVGAIIYLALTPLLLRDMVQRELVPLIRSVKTRLSV